MTTFKVLAIIPARAGSKRVPAKNFRPFAGTTLVDIAIRQSLGAQLVTDTVLSSDSEEVLKIGRNYPEVISLARPKEYAEDDSPAIDYVRHALDVRERSTSKYDLIAIIQPSSPLRTSADIDATIRLLTQNPSADSSVSVVKVPHMIHPLKLKVMDGDMLLPFIEDEQGRFSSADLPDIFVRNCAVYATWRKELETRPDVIGSKSLGYVMPPETSVDINHMIDFEFAEYMFLKSESDA